MLAVQTEQLETQFAEANSTGEAVSREDLDVYQRLANSMRRLLESVGLERRARDITPSVADWIEQQGNHP